MDSTFSLRDRFVDRTRPVLATGVQTLVRLVLLQAEADRAAGLRTAGLVSGYRGSPLGTLDSAFAGVRDLTDSLSIVVRPAVNEELAATAIAGSQQIERSLDPRVQGVYSLWYGKGPGLDRAADAVRHGNVQGSSRYGGVLLAIGDDHMAKSSTLTCNSDSVAAALQVPLLYPSDANDILTFGLHGFAMSRLSGSWIGMKIVPDVADATFTVDPPSTAPIVLPEVSVPAIGLHNRWPEMPLEQELRQQDFRLPAVSAFLGANPLDRIFHRGPDSSLGLLSAGKSWNDLREALRLLGIGPRDLERLGITLFKQAMIWPIQPAAIEFARGLDTLIVVEEKGPFVENQLRAALYGRPDAPMILGKTTSDGSPLFKATGDLSPELIARGLGNLLAGRFPDEGFAAAVARLPAPGISIAAESPISILRKPFFCSGCPHNRSTTVPEGSRALAGIGCHGLAAYNRPRTESFAQMGGEGVHWVGLAPFTNERHVFANIGDGTYFHSGLLAIRQAVAARVNITYKLLYNSAVAMTGGQHVDGELSVVQAAAQLRAEGVGTIVVASDDPARHDGLETLVDRVVPREEFEAVQLDLRDFEGVSVIIYDQMCATERRRNRKRGKAPEATSRIFINELVCEGCGDCSVKSNCLSVEPVESPFGTKRRINQSSCNTDLSCLEGFCPSFVRIEGAAPRRAVGRDTPTAALPAPKVAAFPHERIVVAGIGGTGVVTIGALLATAAHMGGGRAAVLDQVGMAQKGGAVASHVHLAQDATSITALRLPAGTADLVIACDEIVANSADVYAAIDPGRTWVLANSDVAVTGDFTQNRDAIPDRDLLTERLRRRAGNDRFVAHPFTRLARGLVGDAIGSNLMMVGYAFQRGWINIDDTQLIAAVEVNGQGVAMNKSAFRLGRQLAITPEAVYAAAGLPQTSAVELLDDLVEQRAAFLADYQDAAYGERFRRRIAAVRTAESAISKDTVLAEAVARSLFKLMAYKDEYEVARLYTDGSFLDNVSAQFEGDMKITLYMAPPAFARRDRATGHLRKRAFGPWIFKALRILSRLRRLRGTAFDPFGYTSERRSERALVAEFETWIDATARDLTPTALGRAIEIARLPLQIRGYGHVKERAIVAYRAKLKALSDTTVPFI